LLSASVSISISISIAAQVAPGMAADAYADRPAFSAPESLRPTDDGRFLIHYTVTGADAVDGADLSPMNGVPDPVDAIETGLAVLWDAFVATDGWPPPPADQGAGGDDRLDVYVRDLEVNGFAHAEPLADGTGEDCWIEIDPMTWFYGQPTMSSIAAHELHHCLQFAVSRELASWIYEATATWAQYLLFTGDPTLDQALWVLWSLRLTGSERRLDDVDGRFEYAGLIWIEHVVDRAGGDRALLLELWNAMAAEGGWREGHQTFLSERGLGTLDDAAASFAVWNWFACARDDGAHYDDSLPCELDAHVSSTSAAPGDAGTTGPIGARGSAYVEIRPDGATADLHVTAEPSGAARLQLLAIDDSGAHALETAGAAANEPVSFVATDWNRRTGVVLVMTALDDGTTVSWNVTADGEYAPPTEPSTDEGCSCAVARPRRGRSGGLPWILALAFAHLVRRPGTRRNVAAVTAPGDPTAGRRSRACPRDR
jgi:hypothetical protein